MLNCTDCLLNQLSKQGANSCTHCLQSGPPYKTSFVCRDIQQTYCTCIGFLFFALTSKNTVKFPVSMRGTLPKLVQTNRPSGTAVNLPVTGCATLLSISLNVLFFVYI
jgi:hypothetical protein